MANLQKDIVDLQDIEKIQFLQTLQSDPAKYSAYIADKSKRILSETVDTKRASFVKVSGDMARMMDMDHNSIAALNRTNDLMSTQDQIIREQSRQVGTITATKDMTRRQVEINNWYYENKRETLFILQLILLVVLTLVVVLGLTSYGYIAKDAGDYLMAFVIIIGLGTWMYRWYYTTRIRDPRYWNQRRFEADGKRPEGSGKICFGSDGITGQFDSGVGPGSVPIRAPASQAAASTSSGSSMFGSMISSLAPEAGTFGPSAATGGPQGASTMGR